MLEGLVVALLYDKYRRSVPADQVISGSAFNSLVGRALDVKQDEIRLPKRRMRRIGNWSSRWFVGFRTLGAFTAADAPLVATRRDRFESELVGTTNRTIRECFASDFDDLARDLVEASTLPLEPGTTGLAV